MQLLQSQDKGLLVVVNERELDPGLERLRPLGDVASVIGINCCDGGIPSVAIKFSLTVGDIVGSP